jgi:hypothetical protein
LNDFTNTKRLPFFFFDFKARTYIVAVAIQIAGRTLAAFINGFLVLELTRLHPVNEFGQASKQYCGLQHKFNWFVLLKILRIKNDSVISNQ